MTIYYVYAYLRSKDSDTAKAGTPYYIGKGKSKRAWSRNHSINLPKNPDNIVILESNLTEEEAYKLESNLIQQHGRKDLGTGILHNKSNGGDGFTSEDATLNNLKRIAKGNHPFIGDKNPVHSLIAEGKHNFLGDGTFQRTVALNRVAKGTHPLLGAKSNNTRLANGTHPSQIKNTCEYCGVTASLGMFKRWHGDNCKKKQ